MSLKVQMHYKGEDGKVHLETIAYMVADGVEEFIAVSIYLGDKRISFIPLVSNWDDQLNAEIEEQRRLDKGY